MNRSVAKDRSWFGDDYTSLNSSVGNAYCDSPVPVIGIGTVELKVKRSPNASGPRAHSVLRLSNVLHAPASVCNIIGAPILDRYKVAVGPVKFGQGHITDRDGKVVAYFPDEGRFLQVKLSGPPVGPKVGPTPFDPSVHYLINARWADSERAKWEASRVSSLQPTAHANPPFSAEEKQWLKQHFGNEFKFLTQYGLKIYDDEDREEGRLILRAIMAGSDDEDDHSQSDRRG